MPDNYYNENPGGDMVPAGSDAAPPASPTGEKEDYGETFLVPKSAFEGKSVKPGDQFYFTVKQVYEDEVEMAYTKDDEPIKGEAEEGTMEKSHGDLESMAE